MKKEWLIKTLALGVVFLFICTGFVSAFNVNQYDKSNTAMDNHPPSAPWITGPDIVSPGIHEWKFVSTDPDGDNVSYEIDWGDGWIDSWLGWYASGEKITVSHDYQAYGKFRLMARAKDIHNTTGEWGSGGDVIVSKSNQIVNLPFLQFLEQIHYAFPILKYILGGW